MNLQRAKLSPGSRLERLKFALRASTPQRPRQYPEMESPRKERRTEQSALLQPATSPLQQHPSCPCLPQTCWQEQGTLPGRGRRQAQLTQGHVMGSLDASDTKDTSPVAPNPQNQRPEAPREAPTRSPRGFSGFQAFVLRLWEPLCAPTTLR